MIEYRTAYDLIMELQEQLEQDLDDQELGRHDFRKIQALSATYTLQEYLATPLLNWKPAAFWSPKKRARMKSPGNSWIRWRKTVQMIE